MSGVNDILIPNISKISKYKNINNINNINKNLDKKDDGLRFKKILEGVSSQKSVDLVPRLSVHAAKRLQERNVDFDTAEFVKLKGAMEKLRAKGGNDSLVITEKAAYIIDIKNNKIVTAIDKNSMTEQVFTKIDSTMFVD